MVAADPPLKRGSAQFLLDLYATQVSLQGHRALDGQLSLPLAERNLDIKRLADIAMFAGALVRFGRTLVKLADAYPEHPIATVHVEFSGHLPGLAAVRNSLEHGEDWLRGAGWGNGQKGRKLDHIQALLGGDDIVIGLLMENEPYQQFLSVRDGLNAVEEALASITQLLPLELDGEDETPGRPA